MNIYQPLSQTLFHHQPVSEAKKKDPKPTENKWSKERIRRTGKINLRTC